MQKKGSAAKRHRQSEKRRLLNRMVRTRVRNSIKLFHAAVENNNTDDAKTVLQLLTKLIDTAQRKGVYHRNTAARTKSRLHKRYNMLVSSVS